MAQRPTILDVAKAAGVSKSTVSLVLQNSPKVKAETRERVHQVMCELGYVYNRSAAQLRSANTGLVGLLINDLQNPFFTELAASLQMAFSKRYYTTVIANVDEDPAIQAQVIQAMIEHGVSGVVASPTPTTDLTPFENLLRQNIPMIQVTRSVTDRHNDFPLVAPDNVRCGQLATEHLIASGCRNIAFIGGAANVSATQERLAGYTDVIERAHYDKHVFIDNPRRQFGIDMASILMRNYPHIDGVVCFNDLVALGLVTGCARIGRPIDRQFQIIGVDDIVECAQIYPALSSVRNHIGNFGRDVAHTMLDWIENGRKPPPVLRTAINLIVRETSGFQ